MLVFVEKGQTETSRANNCNNLSFTMTQMFLSIIKCTMKIFMYRQVGLNNLIIKTSSKQPSFASSIFNYQLDVEVVQIELVGFRWAFGQIFHPIF